jgi:hypothetical protein
MSLTLARKWPDDDPQKNLCSQDQTQRAGQMQHPDFVDFFGECPPPRSTKRRAGPAGAANSAASAL